LRLIRQKKEPERYASQEKPRDAVQETEIIADIDHSYGRDLENS
jgi:hypothetical protein